MAKFKRNEVDNCYLATIGYICSYWRRQKNITQKEIASDLMVQRTTITKFEGGLLNNAIIYSYYCKNVLPSFIDVSYTTFREYVRKCGGHLDYVRIQTIKYCTLYHDKIWGWFEDVD